MNRKRKQKLHRIYDEIPKIKCKGLCQSFCGAIGMTGGEKEEMVKASGVEPHIVGEAMTCNYLKDGRCSIYNDRPFICRSWGVIPAMTCPHGCEVERMLTPEEFLRIGKKVHQLGGPDVYKNCTHEQWKKDIEQRKKKEDETNV